MTQTDVHCSVPNSTFSLGNHTGEIVRDCMVDSSLLLPGEYETCEGDKCNAFNFPRDRLLCQQCDNCDQIQREPELCRLYFHYHSACVSRIDEDSNQIKRGCQMDHEDTFCDDGNTLCVYCMYDDCNRDPRERSITLQCYFCDSSEADCYAVQDHTKVSKKTKAIRMGEVFYCWTMFAGPNNGIVFRYNELDNGFQKHFMQFCGGDSRDPTPQCPRCFGNGCNKHHKTGRCYECLEDDPECDSRGQSLTPLQCDKNYLDNFGCYGLLMSEEIGSVLRRGCITDLDYLHQKSCIESQSCFFCRSDYCNHQANVCYFCKESPGPPPDEFQHDSVVIPSCVNTTKDKWDVEYCGSGDSCYLHMSGEGPNMVVERGCMSGNLLVHPMKELLNPGTFQLCSTPLCNDWGSLIPTHHCYNLADEKVDCSNTTNNCFTAFYVDASGKRQFSKGCYYPLYKFNMKQMICDKHIDSCEICEGDLCNDQKVFVPMVRKCLVCNDRRLCMFYDGTRKLTDCVGTKYFYDVESCFYGLDPKSNNVTRGCTMLVYPGRHTPPSSMLYCPKNGCNFGSVNDYQCYQCDSNSRSAAPGYCFVVEGARKEVILKPSACAGTSYFQDGEKGCYTYYTPTSILKRGCIRHLTAETIAFCERNQTHCRLCYEEGCNGQNINGVPRDRDRVFVVLLIFLYSIIKFI